MTLNEELERSIGITLGGFLIAVASICISIMASNSNGAATINNEVFGALGLASLLTSAFMIDAILDKAGCGIAYRFKDLLNGGYTLFCLIISGLSAGIILLYHSQEGGVTNTTFIIIALSSNVIFLKLMMDERDHVLGPILFLLYLLAFFSA